MYPKTSSGLLACYTAAIPFFRGTVESDLFFSIAFFEVPVLAHIVAAKLQGTRDHTAAA
jgi:hypothetical protein